MADRYQRQDSLFKRFSSYFFYKVLTYLTGVTQDGSVANFGIYKKEVIKAVCSMRESIRYFPTMIKWVGFKSTKIRVEHNSRFEGETSYNLKKLIQLSLNIILAYSDKPLRLMIKFGFLISSLSVLVGLYTLIQWVSGEILVLGYTSLILSIWFLSGVMILTLGVVGLYVGKTFEGVKNRPIYIVAKRINSQN